MLMALNSRGWTEPTEPCKCFTAKVEEDDDGEDVMRTQGLGKKCTLGHQQHTTLQHFHTGTHSHRLGNYCKRNSSHRKLDRVIDAE